MEIPRQHRQQVDHGGSAFIVCAERFGVGIRVWIERSESVGPWATLANGQVVPEGPDRRNEFAVSTDDLTPLAEQIAFASGLFQRTGRSLQVSQRALAIWSLSASSPLRIREGGQPEGRMVHDPLGANGQDVSTVMTHFLDTAQRFHVAGIAVTAPDVYSDDIKWRVMVAATSQKLHALNPQLFQSERWLHPATDWGMLPDSSYAGASAFVGLGYQAWCSVTVSLMNGQYYEVTMLGAASLAEPVRAQAAAVTALNIIPTLRRAALPSLKISAREYDVLRIGLMELKEAAKVLGVSCSAVRKFRESLRTKIGGRGDDNEASWEQTYVRAQKLGVLD